MENEKLLETQINDVNTFEDEEVKDFYTPDEVLEIIDKLVPKVVVDLSELDGMGLDKKEFAKGLNEMSKTCGKITALCSVGFTVDMAMDYLLNIEKINSDNQVIDQMKKVQI